jgi:hypothetical protein
MVALKAGRVMAVGIAAVALSGVAVVADAATKSSGYTACSNSHHVLAMSKHGKCAKHFHKVKLGARGPAGPSDLYTAAGSVDLTASGAEARPATRLTNRPSLVAPPVHLKLPAGSYLITWRVDFNVSASSGGSPVGQSITAALDCSPQSISGSGTSFGPEDAQYFPLSPFGYDNGTDTSTFRLRTPLSDSWALNVPSRGATMSIICLPPALEDEFGATSTADTSIAGGELVATKVGSLHQQVPTGH